MWFNMVQKQSTVELKLNLLTVCFTQWSQAQESLLFTQSGLSWLLSQVSIEPANRQPVWSWQHAGSQVRFPAAVHVACSCLLWYPIIGRSCHKYLLLFSTSFIMTNTYLTKLCFLWQMCSLRQKTSFVVTKVCLSQQNLCHDRRVCCDKTFVATKIFCRSKRNFVATRVLLQQAYFCHDKTRVLSRQKKTCLSQQNFCRNKHDTYGSSHQW